VPPADAGVDGGDSVGSDEMDDGGSEGSGVTGVT